MTKLSIITINRNNAAGLRRTIESVASQTYTDFEYIIIDGASTDWSVEVIKEFENLKIWEFEDKKTEISSSRLQWVSEPDKGIYNAMNKGILKAKGEYCLFLNSGDYLVNQNVLEDIFIQNNHEDLVYGDLARSFSDGTKDIVKMPDQLSSSFLYNASLAHPSTFIRRNLFLKYGLYDEKYKITGDHAFFVKIILSGNITSIHKTLVVADFMMDGTCNKMGNFLDIQDERRDAYNEYLSPAYIKLINDYDALNKNYHKLLDNKGIVLLKKIKNRTKKINLSFKRGIKTYFIYRILNPFKINYLEVPIIINNRNRLSYLKKLIDSLEKRGYRNIYIIDNNSEYPPLLEFYNKTSFKVNRLKFNGGFCALWDTTIFENSFKNQFYVYTDSDMELSENCPTDFLNRMLYNLWKFEEIDKIGLSIIIDNLPEYYSRKNEVINHEKKFWKTLYAKNLYDALVDTTFALYRKNKFGPAGYVKSVRIKPPCSITHLPWYENTSEPTEENLFYINHSQTRTHWTK